MTAEAILHPWTVPWTGTQQGAAENPAGKRMEADAALVSRCLHGDGSAWEALVRSHSRLIYGTCYRFTGDAEQAHDLTQEVFLRVFRSLRTFDAAAGGFRTWLLRLTRNLLIDYYRQNRKHRVLDPLEPQETMIVDSSGPASRSDHAVRSREAGELLSQALARLSAELREAVILRDLQELEYRDIAEVLDVPEGTVKSRINRGRRELAKHLRAMGVRP
jgi:RNA polymerase sigma-70 factor (ECF subfamily)